MKRVSESGAAIVYILIAIALLAALSFAVTRNNRASVMSLSEDQLKMESQQITEYANTLATAVQKLKLRGCGDNEISAGNNCSYGANPSAPADGHCDIFQPAGAGLQCRQSPYAGELNNAKWDFTFAKPVRNVGTSCGGGVTQKCTEMVTNYGVPLEICQQLNEEIGLATSPPPEATMLLRGGALGNSTWDGTSYPGMGGTGDPTLAGILTGCYRYRIDGTGACTGAHCGYYFFQVLMAR